MPTNPLGSDERLVFRGTRGGRSARGLLWGCLILFLGLQALGVLTTLSFLSRGEFAAARSGLPGIAILAVAGGVWWALHRRPACVVTNRRVLLTRLLRAPIAIDVADVAGATRFVVHYTKYGRVVNSVTTNHVVIQLRGGGGHRTAPILEADQLRDLLQGVASGWIDLACLPDVDGGPARAFQRTDLFFALSSVVAGGRRGPVLAGPTRIVAFAQAPSPLRVAQLLTIVGSERSAADVETALAALAQNGEWGQIVTMEREERTLLVEGHQLVLVSSDHRVIFELAPADAERASAFTKPGPHAYR